MLALLLKLGVQSVFLMSKANVIDSPTHFRVLLARIKRTGVCYSLWLFVLDQVKSVANICC